MKAYIIVKEEYIEGDLENYVQTTILDVCLHKELAINLQKKYFLKFLLSQKGISKEDIEKYKQRAENFVGDILSYKDYCGFVLKEYNIVEEESKMETKEQRVERLKTLVKHYKALSNQSVIRVIADKRIKECEQELKELEDGNKNKI